MNFYTMDSPIVVCNNGKQLQVQVIFHLKCPFYIWYANCKLFSMYVNMKQVLRIHLYISKCVTMLNSYSSIVIN